MKATAILVVLFSVATTPVYTQELTIRHDFINNKSIFIADDDTVDVPCAGNRGMVRVCIDSLNPLLYTVTANAQVSAARFTDASAFKAKSDEITNSGKKATAAPENMPVSAENSDVENVLSNGDDNFPNELLKQFKDKCLDVLNKQELLLKAMNTQNLRIHSLTSAMRELMTGLQQTQTLERVNGARIRLEACRLMARYTELDCDAEIDKAGDRYSVYAAGEREKLRTKYGEIRNSYTAYLRAIAVLQKAYQAGQDDENNDIKDLAPTVELILKDFSLVQKRYELIAELQETFTANYGVLTGSILAVYRSIMHARFERCFEFTAAKGKFTITLEIRKTATSATREVSSTSNVVRRITYTIDVRGGYDITFSRGIFLPVFFDEHHYTYLNKEGIVTRGQPKSLQLNAAQNMHVQLAGRRDRYLALTLGIGARINTESLDWRVLLGPSFVLENSSRLLFHTGLFAGVTERLNNVKVGDMLSSADEEIPMESTIGYGWFFGISYNFPD